MLKYPVSSLSCEWCKNLMGWTETTTSAVSYTVNGVPHIIVHLCYKCRTFAVRAETDYTGDVLANIAYALDYALEQTAFSTYITDAINGDDLVEGNSDQVSYPWI